MTRPILDLVAWTNRIESWRDDPKGGYDQLIELVGDLDAEMRQILRIRHEKRVLGRESE